MKIPAQNEGREGIYTVNASDVIAWLKDYPEEPIHNSICCGSVILGADWDKQAVIDYLADAERVAVMTGQAKSSNVGHSLAVIKNNELYVFDVDISEKDLTIA